MGLHLIVLAFVAAITRAEAEADADAQVHHGGTYGYTPVPAPVYGPEPAYHEAPVYEAAVTPFIHHETPAPCSGSSSRPCRSSSCSGSRSSLPPCSSPTP